MQSFAEAGGNRFVGAGTCAEYDWRFGFLSENLTQIRPHTPFGRFKAALGLASEALAETLGMSFAWGRVFFVYGPHESASRLVGAVIASLSEGQRVKTTHGRQIRDFSHVADIAGGFAALLDSMVTSSVNLGSGHPTAVRELVQVLSELLRRPELVDYGALPLAVDEPPLLLADTRRLREEVGFFPKFNLTDGLRATLEEFRRG
jgi:nucleoside-diphosphate-sugar epimerase